MATVRPSPTEPQDPLIAIREYGRGRTMVFASDTTPHWGVNFMKWRHFQMFWRAAVTWLGGEEE